MRCFGIDALVVGWHNGKLGMVVVEVATLECDGIGIIHFDALGKAVNVVDDHVHFGFVQVQHGLLEHLLLSFARSELVSAGRKPDTGVGHPTGNDCWGCLHDAVVRRSKLLLRRKGARLKPFRLQLQTETCVTSCGLQTDANGHNN